jgi:hypothetical protein
MDELVLASEGLQHPDITVDLAAKNSKMMNRPGVARDIFFRRPKFDVFISVEKIAPGMMSSRSGFTTAKRRREAR